MLKGLRCLVYQRRKHPGHSFLGHDRRQGLGRVTAGLKGDHWGVHGVQVVPRPLQSVLPLQVPVASAEASSAPLEADHLRQGLLLAHMRNMQARVPFLLGHAFSAVY